MYNTISLLLSPPALDADPIEAIEYHQSLYIRSELRYGAAVRNMLTFALDFVKQLRLSKLETNRFLKHAFWVNKPYKPNPDRLPLLVMQFIYGVAKSGGAKYERARKHSRIVEWYLDKDYTSDEMRDDLRDKALDDVEDRIEGEQRVGDTPDLGDDERRNISTEDERVPNNGSLTTGRGRSEAISSAPAVRTHVEEKQGLISYPFDDLREVAIEADLQKIDYLRQLPVGFITLVRIKRKPDSDDWAKFEAVALVELRGP